ncbi:MAG: hypothetical protein INR62_01650 [Rhodospirillales bacterium]|nr:hypothetical protein [Acetobacter sp.]
MATYRAYLLDAHFRFLSVRTNDRATDEAALIWATEVALDHRSEGAEVWEGARLVGKVSTPGAREASVPADGS